MTIFKMHKTSFLSIITLFFCFLFISQKSNAQSSIKLYDPAEDAKVHIAAAMQKAKAEGKHVFLQIGGNWCSWCKLFDSKISSNDTLKNAMDANYVVYHVNYSPENYNKEVLASLGYPQRFGFPVFVILDANGNRLHTENSAYLEEGKGHSSKKVLSFLQSWSPAALNPKLYEK